MRPRLWRLGPTRVYAPCNRHNVQTRPYPRQLLQKSPLSRVPGYFTDELLPKYMSSSASTRTAPAVEVGRIVPGARWDYRLHQLLEGGMSQSTVFKAEILPRKSDARPARWAAIKMAPNNRASLEALEREYDIYSMHNVASKSCFRDLYDVIGGNLNAGAGIEGLVFEWMDCTLANLSPKKYQRNPVIIKAIVDAVLHGLIALEMGKLISNPTAYCSLVSTLSILLPKWAIWALVRPCNPRQLGTCLQILVLPDGYRGAAQPFAMRAPEVYMGLGCIHRSSIWALAATLFCWVRPGVLGAANSQIPFSNEAWCIVKLRRLFPNWVVPPIEDDVCRCEFELADALIEESTPRVLEVSSLEEELEATPTLPEIKDLLRFMLIIDAQLRPTAAEVLRSKEYLALEKETQK
ncbi:hypothetical protein FH972_024099 [Carpinus fangiana]|uniref:Protein kinase domain-containing protein n=1 Tax=Carpinus fangiana TaxID=176857 RepID=A0A5N6KXC5_9ROSI|nr:hypothetical protein FH972_024099 [Carpinus fangiana]